ncbi:hypothetical protein K788_0008009 [Paraburkholderia caribensis MBA4]|uniref:Uncharacterized protein n=1 Tax=Paraburkholderia caribensis MBA4 TaxID=1323664 RepID=A0A0N7JTD9_9BURK|nr:hypothetical protein K788_0008009 [Paraburkholderia caribensis MBA4]
MAGRGNAVAHRTFRPSFHPQSRSAPVVLGDHAAKRCHLPTSHAFR